MIPNALPQSLIDNPRLDEWVAILPEGAIGLATGKVELGQGVLTALAQIAAEELDVALARIRVVSGDTARTPNEGFTAGSLSIQMSGGAIRLACAEVRQLLLEAAAARLACPVAALAIADGAILKDGASTGLNYWSLASEVDLARPARGTAPAKAAGALHLVGTSAPRLDLPGKLGGAPFIQDLAPHGLLHARVLHRPRKGARLAELDAAGAVRAGRERVEIVRFGDIAAVLGEDEADVARAFERLRERARWEGGALEAGEDEAAHLLKRPLAPPRHAARGADTGATRAGRLEATYSKPYIAHASIAPSCGLARFADGVLTVWSHTQGVFPLRAAIARALKLDPANVRVIHHQGAGCYGHNGADDAAFDAALLALARPGRPVRVLWTREDELGVAPFGSAMVVRTAADLDAHGRPLAFHIDITSCTHAGRPGINGAVNLLDALALDDPPPEAAPFDLPEAAGGGATRNAFPLYDIPLQGFTHHLVTDPPVRTSSMRGLGAFANVFAIESFMDELAAQAGEDPIAYRLALTSDPRARRVMETAAQMAKWDAGPPEGFARGFAFSRYKGIAAYLALVVELSVEEEVRLARVWCAADGGRIVNPDGAINQIEGGIIQAASWTLTEQVRFADGKVASDRWETYPILRFSQVPLIETRLIGSNDDPPLGIGEVSQGPTAAAIANAVAQALGARLRHLPLTRTRIMAALLAED